MIHSCAPLIFEHGGGILCSYVENHPEQRHDAFLYLLGLTVGAYRGPWLDNFVDEALDGPTIRASILTLPWDSTIKYNVDNNLRRRPASRHHSFTRELYPTGDE